MADAAEAHDQHQGGTGTQVGAGQTAKAAHCFYQARPCCLQVTETSSLTVMHRSLAVPLPVS